MEPNQSTSPTSPKRYQVTFYSGEPLLISEAMYQKWCEEDAAGVMLIDRAKTIKLKDRIIRTSDISGIDEFRDYETENKWRMPEGTPINLENLEILRRMKRDILDNHEAYDPDKHLPPKWRAALQAQGVDLQNKTITPVDQIAIKDGRAFVDSDGYIIYRYERENAFVRKQRAEKYYRDDPLQALIEEAE